MLLCIGTQRVQLLYIFTTIFQTFRYSYMMNDAVLDETL